jgi:hypothetical protein
MAGRLIMAREFVQILIARKIVPPKTQRVVIDAQAEQPVILHYEVLGDESLLEVLQDPGVRLVESEPEGKPE